MPDDSEDITTEIMKAFEDDAQIQLKEDFDTWRDELAALPEDFEQKLDDGITADIELHPLRWMFAGLDLIQSSKSIVSVELTGGAQILFSTATCPIRCSRWVRKSSLRGCGFVNSTSVAFRTITPIWK